MAVKRIDAGPATSYAYAVEHGYTGTEEQWIAQLMEVTENAQAAEEAAQTATEAVSTFDAAVAAGIASVQAEGQTQVTAVGNAGTAQTAAINAAGAAQVSAVEEEGTTQKGIVTAEAGDQLQAISDAGDDAVDAVEAAQATAVGAVETAQSTAVSAVQSAQGTAVSAVQAKGTEVIESIPADYTELTGEVTDLKSALINTSQVVYKTDISASTGLIPFHAKNGDSITISTKDGSNFIGNDQLRFYDAGGAMIIYWSTAPSTVNFRTFTYNKETEALYIGITQVASSIVDYIVENSNNAYNIEQTVTGMQNDISELKTQVDEIDDDLYEQTVILTDSALHPFPISNGAEIVITTVDGTTLPEGNPYFRYYDSNKAYIGQFLCSSAYGVARTVTISADDVAFVGMYTVPAKPIKVYIPDNSKLIPKVDEIAKAVGQNAITVDASGTGDYTSFTEAIYETVDSGRDVYVKPGTYDIVAEYVALFGQSAVDSMADADSSTFNGFQYGVRLRKRKVEFAPGAHLVCDWTGHTVNGTHRFSALGVGYDVEIIGLDLDVTATFYCIHDDYGISTPYTVKYENCRVVGHSIVNTDCIGGGCKKYSRHILKNCYFDNNLTGSATVRYHNTNGEGAEPEIYVSDCYFNNWFTPRWYGTQTSKMRVYVNNCHARAIYKMAESSSYNVDNVELYKWNNEETDPRE